MQTSEFTPGGLLLLSSETPSAELLHQTALRLLSTGEPGDLSTELGSFVDCLAYALAVVFARIQYRQRQIDGERIALTSYELLSALEEEYGLRPGANDTIAQRQLALLAAVKPVLGSRRPVLEQALHDLLGASYIGIKVRNPANSEVDLWPSDLNDNPMLLADATISRKIVRLKQSISTGLGSPQSVVYEPVFPTAVSGHTLAVGDKLIIGPENLGLAERVTVESVDINDPELLFTATFANAHDDEILGVQMPFPAWGSSQRHVFVGVTNDVTLDAEMLRRIHVLMARHVTTCTTWSVCGSSDGEHLGPWTLDDSVLGRLDFNPMATLSLP